MFSSVSAQDPGDAIFNEPKIYEFKFHFNQTNYLDSLIKSHETKEYIPCQLDINGVYYDSVGVRFKGTSSFFGYPGNKKSFRIKFDKYKDYQFDGLKKINLNNGWNDPTMLREKLYLDFLWDNHIPAPRANFAKIYIDSIYWGFYSLIEHVDKTFLKDRFGNNDGNLYKSEYAPLLWEGDDQEKYYDNFELKTNENENNWSELIELINTINDEQNFSAQIESVCDVDLHLKVWAANNLFVNMDAFFASGNNYYLYQNEDDDRFEWIIWDVNLAFGARNGPDSLDIFYVPEDRPLHKNFLYFAQFKDRYLQTMEQLLNSGFDATALFHKIDSLWSMILDDYQADTLKMYTNEEVEKSLTQNLYLAPALKPFIQKRRNSVLQQLDYWKSTGIYNRNETENNNRFNFQLYQNFPNPFNSTTIIRYSLSLSANVELSVFNCLGQKMATLVSGIQHAGVKQVKWNAAQFSSGIYFYQLFIDNKFLQNKKLLLLK